MVCAVGECAEVDLGEIGMWLTNQLGLCRGACADDGVCSTVFEPADCDVLASDTEAGGDGVGPLGHLSRDACSGRCPGKLATQVLWM